MNETILHVDMDAFFASVEQRDRPELLGKPVVVGGQGRRGVVSSASYEARVNGVRSAMPVNHALRICPDAVVCPGRMDVYGTESQKLMELLETFTPSVEPISIDEAFLDVVGATALFGDPVTIGHTIRREIRDQLGLPASVGVAGNKFLAKRCSECAKPDGLFHLRNEDVLTFLHPQPVEAIWGVGAKTKQKLNQAGVHTVGDAAELDRRTLERIIGTAAATQLYQLARGIDDRVVRRSDGVKSVGNEHTFDQDLETRQEVRRQLLAVSEQVARRLREAALAGRTVTLKLRYSSFETLSRSTTLHQPVDDATAIYSTVCELFDSLNTDHIRLRLLGITVSNLTAGLQTRQLSLGNDDRWHELERAADVARDRFGENAITRGALLPRPDTNDSAEDGR